LSYVTSDKKSAQDIIVVRQWNSEGNISGPGTANKVPSVIAYRNENLPEHPDDPVFDEDQWGFAADGLKSYMWTKLLLGSDTQISENEREELQHVYGSGCLNLPRNKGPKEVIADYLGKLYEHFMNKLAGHGNGQIMVSVTPIEFWITVPAMWTEAAKSATREAALTAGFGSRAMDQVYIITEPEAAALSVLLPRVGLGTVTGLEVRHCFAKLLMKLIENQIGRGPKYPHLRLWRRDSRK